MITPEEFVAAGDYLVYHCPTWSWSVYHAYIKLCSDWVGGGGGMPSSS